MTHPSSVHLSRVRPGICVAASLFSLASATSHADEARAALPNAQLGAVFTSVDAADNSNRSAQGEFRITLPVTSFLGASLRGNYADTNIQIDKPDDPVGGNDLVSGASCGLNSMTGTGTLFARRPDFGRVSASFSAARLKSKCGDSASLVSGNSDTLDSTGYSLAAEYYFPLFTVAAEHTVTSFDTDDDRVADVVSASWYPMLDLSVSPHAGRIDGSTQYGFAIEHQPEFLGRGTSVSLSVSNLDLDDDSILTVSLSFAYHFGARVDLKTRDREYR